MLFYSDFHQGSVKTRLVVSEFLGKERKLIVNARVLSNNNKQEQKDMENRLRHETLNHPLVADAVEIFNGKVVDVKIS